MSSFPPMPPLSPPAYPYRPDAPLLSFGPVFSEYISRTTLSAVWPDKGENTHLGNIRIAAALTMLEGFHPRDHLECMLASMGVAFFVAEMECLGEAMKSDTKLADACKLRASAAQMHRCFSRNLIDLGRLQARPLPGQPGDEEPSPDGPPSRPASGKPGARKPRSPGAKPAAPRPAKPAPAEVRPEAPAPAAPDECDNDEEPPELIDESELERDMETRPDGTPGSLRAYAPNPPPEQVYIGGESPLMMALATRPKLWRMVNTPPGQVEENADPPATPEMRPEPVKVALDTRLPLDLNQKYLLGDALSNFLASRYDPDAPAQPLEFEDDSTVELELISTGSDPELEAEKQALMAAHPEGKPVRVIRLAGRASQDEPPDKPPD